MSALGDKFAPFSSRSLLDTGVVWVERKRGRFPGRGTRAQGSAPGRGEGGLGDGPRVRRPRRALPMKPRRTLVLGLDGCSWDLLEPLLQGGELPRLAELRERAALARLDGVAPASPTPAWVTFATGSTPAAHGVLDARQHRGGDGFGPACQDDLQRAPYYLQLGREGFSTVVVNLPLDHSGCEGGLIVNDGLSPDARRILPVGRRTKYLRLLETYPERPVDPADADELCRLAQARFDLARELFLGESWDHFFLLFSEPRWLARASAGALAAGDERAYEAFARLLRQIDAQLGWFVDHAGEALVAVVSAYGHRAETHVLRPEAVLAGLGLRAPAPAAERARPDDPRPAAPRRDRPLRALRPPPELGRDRHGGAAHARGARGLRRLRDGARRARSRRDRRRRPDPRCAAHARARRRHACGRRRLALRGAGRTRAAAGRARARLRAGARRRGRDRRRPGRGALAVRSRRARPGGTAPAHRPGRDSRARSTTSRSATSLRRCSGPPAPGVPSDVEGRVLFEAFELEFAAGRPLREVESTPRDDDPVGHVESRLRALGVPVGAARRLLKLTKGVL